MQNHEQKDFTSDTPCFLCFPENKDGQLCQAFLTSHTEYLRITNCLEKLKGSFSSDDFKQGKQKQENYLEYSCCCFCL